MNQCSLIITCGNEKDLTIVENLLVFLKGQADLDKECSEVERNSPNKLSDSPNPDNADACDNDLRSALSLVACCCVDKQFALTYSRKEQKNSQTLLSWQPVKSLDVRTYLQEIETVTLQLDVERDQSRQKVTKVGIVLNKLADSLPYCGFIFDVYIINPSLGKESRALTLAAIHRLREWHGAAITVVQDSELAEGAGVKDFSLFSPLIIRPTELSTSVQRFAWRGNLFWPGEQSGFAEAGVCLACHNYQKMKKKLDALYFWKPQKQLLRSRGRKKWVYLEEPSVLVFGRQLEVIDCVSVESVPLYMFDSFHLTLYLHSRTRFGRMVQMLSSKDAFLMRLAVFEKKSVPQAADVGLTTQAWKDGVTSNASGMPRKDPENQSVHGREHLILLVPGGQEKINRLRATVILSSCEINPRVFEEINKDFVYNFTQEEQEGQKNEEASIAGERQKKNLQQENVDEKIEKALCRLPMITDSDFLAVEQGFRESLIKFIQEEKAQAAGDGEDFELTIDDLEDVVQLANETVFKLGQPHDLHMEAAVRQVVKPEDFIAFPDNLTAPSEWPERKSLLEIEAKENALPRTQSTDSVSLLMSSPLNTEDSSLDTKDLLHLFDPDGTNDRDKLQPIMLRLPKHKYAKDEEKSLPWPECRNLNYHDIYYEHIEENRKVEEFYQTFRDDILLEETHHICAERPHIPAVRIRRKRGGKSSSSDRRLSNKQKSMMDVTCGGSKLTPIQRSFSSSSAMPPTTPSEKHRRKNELMSSSRRSGPRNLRRMSSLTDDSPFFAPEIPLRRTPSGRLDEPGRNKLPRDDLNKNRQFAESWNRGPLASPVATSSASPSVCGPAYQLTSSSSSPALTFRKATPRPDTVHIFMPPSSSLNWSGQAWESTQGREVIGALGCAGDATPGVSSLQESAGKGDVSFLNESSSASCGVEAEQKSSSESKKSKTTDPKLSRKERHMKKLEVAVSEGLGSAGVGVNDIIYTACFEKLAFITKFYAKQLPTSRNLKEELQKIVQQQVMQVVDLERRRQDMAMKNKLRKSSLVACDKPSSNAE